MMKDHSFVQGYVTKHLWLLQVIYAPSICARGAFLPQSKTLRTKSSAVLYHSVLDMAKATHRSSQIQSQRKQTLRSSMLQCHWCSHIRQCTETPLPHTGLYKQNPLLCCSGIAHLPLGCGWRWKKSHCQKRSSPDMSYIHNKAFCCWRILLKPYWQSRGMWTWSERSWQVCILCIIPFQPSLLNKKWCGV